MKLSAVLITKNEERHILPCLEALSFCDEIIVVDSGSADRTTVLAASLGAKVFTRDFDNYSAQKNFAISRAGGDWVFLIDADERVSKELQLEIQKVLVNPIAEAFEIRRMNQIFGKWMKHGQNANDLQLRLIRKNLAVFEGLVHERIVTPAKTTVLKNPLLHLSTPDSKSYFAKLNQYTGLEAKILLSKNVDLRENKLKSRPMLVFFRDWVLHLGFLDGIEGFMFCVFSSYYDFVKLAKVWELKKKNDSA